MYLAVNYLVAKKLWNKFNCIYQKIDPTGVKCHIDSLGTCNFYQKANFLDGSSIIRVYCVIF